MKDADFSKFDQMEVLINSMTEQERKDPKLIDSSFKRRERIAKGSGLEISDVNRLREALEAQKKIFKQMSNMNEDELEKVSKKSAKFTKHATKKVKKEKVKTKASLSTRPLFLNV